MQNSLPITIATGLAKDENAKNRALYPVDVVHYFIENYVIGEIEP